MGSSSRWIIVISAHLLVAFGAVAVWAHFEAAAALALMPEAANPDVYAWRATIRLADRDTSLLASVIFAAIIIFELMYLYHRRRQQ
jgi:hypothetical protein